MKFFRFETNAYRFFAWWDICSVGLKGLCPIGALAGLVLYLLPGVNSSLAADIVLGALALDFLTLAVLFFTNFYTRLFQRRTQWLFCAAAGVLTLGLVVCVLSTLSAAGSFAGVLCAVGAGLLFTAYFVLPNWLLLKDLLALFAGIAREEARRETERKTGGFAPEAVYTAKK